VGGVKEPSRGMRGFIVLVRNTESIPQVSPDSCGGFRGLAAVRCVAVMLLLAALFPGCGRKEVPPNILLITIDTLRPDRIGAYGNEFARTPNLDRLARKGTLFLNASSVSAWTLPSMATIMTSTYPARHGAYWVDRAIDPDLPTLAETLSEAGYTTAGVHGHLLVSSLYGFDKGFDHLTELGVDLSDEDAAWESALGWREGEPTSDQITSAALDWLEESPSEPFFLWVHYFDPHLPYKPPDSFRDAFDDYPPDRITLNGRPPQKYFRRKNPMPEEMRRRILGLYDGEIFAADRAIGDLLAAYDRAFESEPIIVITSDHGEEFKEHGRLSHTKTLYEELVRIPLMVAGPQIPSRSLVTSPAQNADIFPALLSLVPIEGVEGLQGVPLIFNDDDGSPRQLHLSETRNRSWSDSAGTTATGAGPLFLRSVREGPWKMIFSLLDDGGELYYLPDDPTEQENVADLHADVVERLTRIYEESAAPGKPFMADGMSSGGESFQLNQGQIERLRALGYIE